MGQMNISCGGTAESAASGAFAVYPPAVHSLPAQE